MLISTIASALVAVIALVWSMVAYELDKQEAAPRIQVIGYSKVQEMVPIPREQGGGLKAEDLPFYTYVLTNTGGSTVTLEDLLDASPEPTDHFPVTFIDSDGCDAADPVALSPGTTAVFTVSTFDPPRSLLAETSLGILSLAVPRSKDAQIVVGDHLHLVREELMKCKGVSVPLDGDFYLRVVDG